MESSAAASSMDTCVTSIGSDGECAVYNPSHDDHVMSSDHRSVENSQDEKWSVCCVHEGCCQKRTIQPGSGLYGPVLASVCSVTIRTQKTIDVSLVGYCFDKTVSWQIGDEMTPISRLLEQALMSMKTGEIAEVVISCKKPKIECLKFELTLQDFSASCPPWLLSFPELYSTALRHKETGVMLYQNGDIYRAFAQFRTSARLLMSIIPSRINADESMLVSYNRLLCQCHLNLSACQMKTGLYKHVLTNCSHALNIDPESVKALYRRALAYHRCGDYLEAENDVRAALILEPKSKVLRDLFASIKENAVRSQAKLAAGLSKVFSPSTCHSS